MFIFYLTAMPLFYWAVQSLFDNQNVRVTDILGPAFLGLVIAIPVQMLYWAMDVYFDLKWGGAGVYFYSLLNREGFFYFPLVGLILFLYRRKDDGSLYIREFFGFFTGYYFLLALVDTMHGNVLTSYYVLILPLLRIITVLISGFLINRYLRYKGNARYYTLAVIIGVPFILNIFPMFYILKMNLLFYLIFIPFFIGTLVCSQLELQEKIPG